MIHKQKKYTKNVFLTFLLGIFGIISAFTGCTMPSKQTIIDKLTGCPPYQEEVAFPSYKADVQTANVTPEKKEPEEEEVEPDYLDKMYNEVKEDFEEAGIELDEITNGFQAVGIKLEKKGANGTDLKENELAKELLISLDGDLTFDSGSSNLKNQAKKLVGKMGQGMRKYPYTIAKIEGHTDSDGPAAYNKNLSQRRAESVRQQLITNEGIAAKRIVQVIGYGEERLKINPERTTDDKKKNRRVEIRLIPKKLAFGQTHQQELLAQRCF